MFQIACHLTFLGTTPAGILMVRRGEMLQEEMHLISGRRAMPVRRLAGASQDMFRATRELTQIHDGIFLKQGGWNGKKSYEEQW